MICYLFDAPKYLFFSEATPELLYYSHIPTALAALMIGLLVLANGKGKVLNLLFFLITLSFSVWIFTSLTAWTNIHAGFVSFLWPLFAISSAFIAILSIYFSLVFLRERDISLTEKVTLFTLLLPVLLFSHTKLNFTGFDITNCDAFAFENINFKIYYSGLGALAIIWIGVITFYSYLKATAVEQRKKIIYMSLGIKIFLITFFSTTFIFSYLVNTGVIKDSHPEMYGLFGVTFFLVAIAMLITKFKTFNIKIPAAQFLVVALGLVIASQFTYSSTPTVFILKLITLFLTISIGWILIRSIRKEVMQREEIEKLAHNLSLTNEKLRQLDKLKSEFVSIASHQLRSPITAISGYASLIREGSYGEVPKKVADPLMRIEESARVMASSIEDYLNVSRIEAGNMKYEFTEFNITNLVEHICDDLRPEALRRGLLLTFRHHMDGKGFVRADFGKTSQIIHNLINNAIKYTIKGTISVYVHDDEPNNTVKIDVADTGMGMSQETVSTIFQKFERGKGASRINLNGTGLGLFIARKIAEAMGATITASSDGEGKGSRFTVTFKLLP